MHIWSPSSPMPGLGLSLALLTLFVASIVAIFSLRYMRADRHPRRYFATLGTVVVAVLTLLLAGNVVVLGMAWCASGWLLASLVGHSDGWAEARAAARRTRLSFAVGDGALLVALGLLGRHAGSADLATILANAASLPSAVAAFTALLLVIAASARCALPPFSGWLLSSMTAPTPVSALMHAGLVNAGGFLLIRFAPVMEAAPVARTAAVVLGLCGAIYGIGIMMVRPDVKRSLAGSTVSQMGFMIMSCGLGAYVAALWHIIAHGLFKAWLFLGSGSTIGIKAGSATAPLSGRTALAIAVATFGVGALIAVSGAVDAALVPVLLGAATASATLVASLGGKVPARARVALVVALAALVTFHAGGLELSGLAIGAHAAPLLPSWAALALLVVFLGGWAWQQQRIANGAGLPLSIYVHLMNAGALPADGQGDRQ